MQKRIILKIIFYFSFLLILPCVWFLVERRWLKDLQKKIGEKIFEIWQNNQKLPLIWQKLEEILKLNYEIDYQAKFKENLNHYQKATEFVWDNLKKKNFTLSIDELNLLIKFTDFLQEIYQAITEYNSDVVLLNKSLNSWPSNVAGDQLKLQPIKLIELV